MSISGEELTVLALHAYGRQWLTPMAKALGIRTGSLLKWKLGKVPANRERQVLDLMMAVAKDNLKAIRALSRHIELEIYKRGLRAQVRLEQPKKKRLALAHSRRKALADYEQYLRKSAAANLGHDRRNARLRASAPAHSG